MRQATVVTVILLLIVCAAAGGCMPWRLVIGSDAAVQSPEQLAAGEADPARFQPQWHGMQHPPAAQTPEGGASISSTGTSTARPISEPTVRATLSDGSTRDATVVGNQEAPARVHGAAALNPDDEPLSPVRDPRFAADSIETSPAPTPAELAVTSADARIQLLEQQLDAMKLYMATRELEKAAMQTPQPAVVSPPPTTTEALVRTTQHGNPLRDTAAPATSPFTAPASAAFASLPDATPPAQATGQSSSADQAALRDVQRVHGTAVVGEAAPAETPGNSADVTSDVADPHAWPDHVQQAIASLSQQAALAADTEQRVRSEAYLRLLYLVANQHDEAVKPIDVDAAQREYWKEQIHSLHVLLNEDNMPVPARRHALALHSLRNAADHLASSSTLDLHNLAFCRRVDSFGHYDEFEEYHFKPDQEVLLYVEVENFQCEPKQDGSRQLYETELQGNYQILDLGGRRMADYDLPADVETCRNRRRDYFLVYRIYMPKNLPPGQYRLQLTIRDAKADKSRQTQIDFEIE